MSIAPAAGTFTLDQLPLATPATIAAIDAPAFETLRLMGLGVCEGRRVQRVKAGDPLILQVMGVRIGLSAQLAQCVQVAPVV
jgi:Fe2+ transport system protein FeoA